MSITLKTKSVVKRAQSPLNTTKSTQMLRSSKSDMTTPVDRALWENIEIEYIKNLQQQVQFLELECNYLKQQLNMNGIQLSSTQSADMSKSLKASTQMDIKKNETMMQLLQHNESLFAKEKELLLKEIAQLKEQKNKAEETLLHKSAETLKLKESLVKNHPTHTSTASESQAKDENAKLKHDLELMKSKMDELGKENERMSSFLEISLKQNEADLILAQKNADMSKSNIEKLNAEMERERGANKSLRTQVEQFKLQERLEIKNQAHLKKRIADLEQAVAEHDVNEESKLKSLRAELKSKQSELDAERQKSTREHIAAQTLQKSLEAKIHELNETIEKHNTSHKSIAETAKTATNRLQSYLDDATANLSKEKSTNSELQAKIEHLTRQESIQTNMINSLRDRVNELTAELHEQTRRESARAVQKITDMEVENKRLRDEIARLKQLEGLVQSQKWTELGQLAESIKKIIT